MSTKKSEKIQSRLRRKGHIRKHISGTAERPRLAVYRSLSHIYAQLIDDEKRVTIAGFGTLSEELKKENCNRKSKEAARKIGVWIAEKAKKENIEKVVFDRGRYKFHGIIAELANAARNAGLQF